MVGMRRSRDARGDIGVVLVDLLALEELPQECVAKVSTTPFSSDSVCLNWHRSVIRIMIMIPVYGISSYVSLFSLQAAFFIDAVRDIYEAFVIYVFFQLLIDYLGGERSLLILLHGRPPVHPLFPLNLFKRELDASDPYTYLWLKRGILRAYVQAERNIYTLISVL